MNPHPGPRRQNKLRWKCSGEGVRVDKKEKSAYLFRLHRPVKIKVDSEVATLHSVVQCVAFVAVSRQS